MTTGNVILEKTQRSQKFFNKSSLKFYDVLLYGVISRFAWGAKLSNLDDFYGRHISANHLEVGVGTGFLLRRALSQRKHDRLAFMDLSEACLERSQKRLAAYQPELYRHNLLQPITQEIPQFHSIALNSVLHCIPGSFRDKSIVFTHLKTLLRAEGVLFGTTVLGTNVKKNILARPFMWLMNRLGVFNNQADDALELRAYLEQHFKVVEFTVIGVTAFFAVTI